VRDLEVQALAGCVGGEQHLDGWVVRELFSDLATLSATHTAVNRLDGLRPAEQRPNGKDEKGKDEKGKDERSGG